MGEKKMNEPKMDEKKMNEQKKTQLGRLICGLSGGQISSFNPGCRSRAAKARETDDSSSHSASAAEPDTFHRKLVIYRGVLKFCLKYFTNEVCNQNECNYLHVCRRWLAGYARSAFRETRSRIIGDCVEKMKL